MELVLAVDRTGGIARCGQIPWPFFKDDRDHFRRVTANKTLLVGKKTFDTLPDRPLGLGRSLLVVSSRPVMRKDRPDVTGLHGDVVSYAKRHPELICIGGANLVAQVYGEIHRVYLTHIDADFDCDVHLPPSIWESMQAGARSNLKEIHGGSIPAGEIHGGPYPAFDWWIVEFTRW